MELRDAIDQISAIKTHLAAAERLRGLRAVPVAFSGLLALLAAAAQSLWVGDPLAAPHSYLVLWVGAAAISALAAGIELTARIRRSPSRLSVENALLALRQFAPALFVGAAVTAAVVVQLPEQLWILPGLWQLVFALGVLAAHRLLPGPVFAIGCLYLVTGSTCLGLGSAALSPLAMGMPFAVGQLSLAGILWWHQERPVRGGLR
ncbi:MAG: hypothetical protein H6838_10235 [Planctomycetes bacterium]|nr:hypothetical protein [Planctomycetota bacterium]MCB9885862.1 hypothetical protein [Planctomycetota bacterium]